nr:DinB family protein [Scopulibacillus darangshiensis]
MITARDGFSPQVGRLVSMMNYARFTTLQMVEGLSVEELDFLLDDAGNTIGMLLAHMAAVERAYQILTFEKRDLNDDDEKEIGLPLFLGQKAREEIKGKELDYYLQKLEAVREKTLAGFKERDDDWLEEMTPFWEDLPANNYFKWFHVFEDEINHRGQIRWICKRLPNLEGKVSAEVSE